MRATICHDEHLRDLLRPLLAVRHSHLQPLEAVGVSAEGYTLHYGQPDPCRPDCDGVPGALNAVHEAGLWVGDVLASVGFDNAGRVVLTGVGSSWNLTDPFAGHPSVTGFDLRITWRQQGDLLQMADLMGRLVTCGKAA